MELFRNRNWDIIGKAKLWFTISGVAILLGLVSWGVWNLNYGIDFTGGSLYRYRFSAPLSSGDAQTAAVIAKVRGVLSAQNLGSSNIQVVADDRGSLSNLYLRTPPVSNDEEAARRDGELRAALQTAFPDQGEITDLGRESVGPVVGAELRAKALWAFIVGSILIMLYITIRYEFRFAIAAIVALVHDILLVMGCMAIFRVELNSAFVAAILSVLGYSINDTVVIFDRIRENMRLHRRASFAETANTSLLQTMARSVNTVLTTLITITALVLFGGEAIRGFALTMLFGVTFGCYSSIFVAAPFVVWLEKRAARGAQASAPARARSTARRAPELATETEGNGDTARPAALSGVEKLQREAIDERKQQVSAEMEEKREERRERRKKEKDRASKRGGKPKRRF